MVKVELLEEREPSSAPRTARPIMSRVVWISIPFTKVIEEESRYTFIRVKYLQLVDLGSYP